MTRSQFALALTLFLLISIVPETSFAQQPPLPEEPDAEFVFEVYSLDGHSAQDVLEEVKQLLGKGEQIDADDKRLILRASPATQKKVAELVRATLKPEKEGEVTRTWMLKHARASEVEAVVKKTLRTPSTTVAVDERTNQLIVKGTTEDVNLVHSLVKELDQPVAASSRQHPLIADSVAKNENNQLRVFYLEYSSAEGVASVLKEVYEGTTMKLSVDVRQNRVIVSGPRDKLKEVETLISQLDKAADQSIKRPQPLQPDGSMVKEALARILDKPLSDIEVLREAAVKAEEAAAKAARKLRSRDDFSAAEHEALKRLVRSAFDARQALARAQVAAIAHRMQRLSYQIESRDRIAAHLVARRADDLLEGNIDELSSSRSAESEPNDLAEPKPNAKDEP